MKKINKDKIIHDTLESLLKRWNCDECKELMIDLFRQYGIVSRDENGTERPILDIIPEMMIALMNINKKDRDIHLYYAATTLVRIVKSNGFILLYDDFVANNVFL